MRVDAVAYMEGVRGLAALAGGAVGFESCRVVGMRNAGDSIDLCMRCIAVMNVSNARLCHGDGKADQQQQGVKGSKPAMTHEAHRSNVTDSAIRVTGGPLGEG